MRALKSEKRHKGPMKEHMWKGQEQREKAKCFLKKGIYVVKMGTSMRLRGH